MSGTAWALACALFSWWLGTGLVFLLERAVRDRPRAALGAIVAIGGLSLVGVVQSSQMPQAMGAYLGFASSIGLWGALELSFLTGLVTGPRRHACAPGCHGARHFGHGVLALLYHELALAACGVLVAALCWNSPNPYAACTYGVLWIMRESAKLNLYLGVANPAVELLPRRLAHLACYFGPRGLNALLPVSIIAATIVDVVLVRRALADSASPLYQTGGILLAALLALAILEHLLLILPIRADALWTWATRRGTVAPGSGALPPDGGAAQCAAHGAVPAAAGRARREADTVVAAAAAGAKLLA